MQIPETANLEQVFAAILVLINILLPLATRAAALGHLPNIDRITPQTIQERVNDASWEGKDPKPKK